MDMSIIVKRPFNDDLLSYVSENTGLPSELLGHDPNVFMNYETRCHYDIPNLEQAVKLFEKYANEKKPIYVYCDYDVDGMGAASIVQMLADSLRIPIEVYVPERFADGYGLNDKFVLNHPDGDALLLTFDNGIATNEAIDLAKAKGWMVAVLDHHLARLNERGEVDLPLADVIVDPHITGGTCEDYCGAGLAYKFAERCYQDTRVAADKKQFLLDMMCAQAAVSTVADSVPLTTENYQIVEKGFRLLSEGKCSVGLKALADKFNLTGNDISVDDVNFGLVAALNAWGRLEDEGSKKVVECLTYNGPYNDYLKKMTDTIVAKNELRKALTSEALARAEELVVQTGQEDNNIIVIYDPDCRHGLCGLAAGRLCEKYAVPVLYLTDAGDGIIAGSGRSCGDINLKEALDRTAEFLASYGGHAAACGVALQLDKLDDFIPAINEIVPEPARITSLTCDMVCSIDDVPGLYSQLSRYMWGQGNDYPTLLFQNIDCSNKLELGATGSTLKFKNKTSGDIDVNVMAFNKASDYAMMGAPGNISVIGKIGDNVWKGNHTLQIISEYFEPSYETRVITEDMLREEDIEHEDDIDP